jgi:hypothetical protein
LVENKEDPEEFHDQRSPRRDFHVQVENRIGIGDFWRDVGEQRISKKTNSAGDKSQLGTIFDGCRLKNCFKGV